MAVSHEALSVTIMFRPIIISIVRVFVLTHSQLHMVTALHQLVGITAFDCEQLFILLRHAVRAGIREKYRLIIVHIWFPNTSIWVRVNCLCELLSFLVR
jgi:hypothetical protein